MAVRPILLASVFVAFVLAGCSDGNGGDTDNDDDPVPTSPSVSVSASATTSPTPSSTTSTSSAPAAPQTIQKDVADNSFPDGTFTVRAGDTIVWTHRGNAPHSVTSDGNFDSHPACTFATSAAGQCMAGGDTFEVTLSAGEYDYRCRIHAGMTGTITVT